MKVEKLITILQRFPVDREVRVSDSGAKAFEILGVADTEKPGDPLIILGMGAQIGRFAALEAFERPGGHA